MGTLSFPTTFGLEILLASHPPAAFTCVCVCVLFICHKMQLPFRETLGSIHHCYSVEGTMHERFLLMETDERHAHTHMKATGIWEARRALVLEAAETDNVPVSLCASTAHLFEKTSQQKKANLKKCLGICTFCPKGTKSMLL